MFMIKFNESYATAPLFEHQLFFIQAELKALVEQSWRVLSENTPQCLPFTMTSPWGKELRTDLVHRTARDIEDYIKKFDLIPVSISDEESLESFLNPIGEEEKPFCIELTFSQWGVIEHLLDEREKESDMNDLYAAADDWAPPDNFRNGTDDEREIWDAHVSSQRERSKLKG